MAERKGSKCGLHLVNTDRGCNNCTLPRKCIGADLDQSQTDTISSVIRKRGPFQL